MPQRPTAPPAFADLGLDPRLLESLTTLGYEVPTPIQAAAIPPLLQGRDVVARAATGTGKTAAFALPLLHRLASGAPPRERTTALVLVPTRELAMQVAEAVHRYGKVLGVQVLPIYGGASMSTQIRGLRRGVDVVIATPGRALDHLRRGTLTLATLRTVVLDEADEMLDMGFAEDLDAILAATPAQKQTALFSATLPSRTAALARAHLQHPVRIEIERAAVSAGKTAGVRQTAYVVARAHKLDALGRILDVEHPSSAMIFCRTRLEVDELAETLAARGHRAEALHGGLSQDQRDRVMQKFRGRKADLLVATDVAARGLDVPQVSHVINYDVPVAAEDYVHRIGRTGRAGRAGIAITLAEPREQRLLHNIERVTRQHLEIAPVPTVADLRARRIETLRTRLATTLAEEGLEPFRAIAATLAATLDPLDIAAAALKQLQPSLAADQAKEIPSPAPAPARERPAKATRARVQMERLFIGAGRAARLTPADLVGAIANEAGVSGRAIGAITIAERHATVDVQADVADAVIAALRGAVLKGRRVTVRRFRRG